MSCAAMDVLVLFVLGHKLYSCRVYRNLGIIQPSAKTVLHFNSMYSLTALA